ncbi:MAG: AAA family ATPase [Bradymonadales bacterium]|nr:AAA family ATPase [Bradymonadales bacterium]
MPSVLQFDRLLVDLDHFVAYRDGKPVELRRQAFDVLVHLLLHHERVVTRQELFERFWSGKEAGDWSLSTCVKEIRRAIGDTRKQHRLIKTVYGLGYTIIVPVIGQVGDDAVKLLQALVAPASGQSPPPEAHRALAMPAADSGGTPLSHVEDGVVHLVQGGAAHLAKPPSSAAVRESSPAPAEASTDLGDRTTATILVCALEIPATAATNTAQAQQVRHLFHRTLQKVIQDHGGSVQETSAGEVVATFGIPLELSHHAERAVGAALEIARRWAGQGAEHLGRIPVRIYIDTRWIVGAPSLRLDRSDLESVKVTADWLRSRLRVRDSSEIVVNQGTTQRISAPLDIELTRLGGVEGVPLFRLSHKRRGSAERRAPRNRSDHPFVARETELATLGEHLERLLVGRGALVLVIGEPGIGKSRLVEEFYRSAGTGEVAFKGVECTPHSQWMPYGVLAQLARELCAIKEGDELGEVARKVNNVLSRSALEGDPELPILLSMLLLTDHLDLPATGDPARLRSKLFDACQRLVIDSSVLSPLVLVVENLQWIDPTSSEWFDLLVERIDRLPILLLATCRPGTDLTAGWRFRGHLMALQPLADGDSRRIVSEILAPMLTPRAIIDRIVEKGEGNPLFLEELAMACREGGETALSSGLPATVQAVLTSRIDSLRAGPRRVLEVASCLDNPFDVSLLKEVTGLSERSLERHLLDLASDEFLQTQAEKTGHSVRFKHAMIREAAYESCPLEDRRQIHGKVAQVLLTLHADLVRARPELVAEHTSRAGQASTAMLYWQQAALLAAQHSAPDEAIEHVDRGLALLEQVSDVRERTDAEIALRSILVRAWIMAGGPEVLEVQQERQRVAELQESLGRDVIMPEEMTFLIDRGDFVELARRAQELIEREQHNGNVPLLLSAHSVRGLALGCLGRGEESRFHIDRVLELKAGLADEALVSLTCIDPVVESQAMLGAILCQMGYFDQGKEALVQALQRAEELRRPFSEAWVLFSRIALSIWLRDVPTTRDMVDRLAQLARVNRFPTWHAVVQLGRAWLVAVEGQRPDAAAMAHDAIRRFRSLGGIGNLTPHCIAAAVYLAAREGKRGLEIVEEGLEAAGRTGQEIKVAMLWRLRGELLTLDGVRDEREAERSLEQALRTARPIQAKFAELRAAVTLARLWRRQGKHQAATELLRPIYDWFVEAGQSVPDLLEAAELLGILPQG